MVRIAFFGSDLFSIGSLSRIIHHDISVDVITRRLKPSGRHLNTVEDLPLGIFASARNITLHRADTKYDILKLLDNNTYDLAVAVSYGRLIPKKFIEAMTYGGINVHPSFLPKYSGSSPIQYALINDDKTTGVTVQTLHPTKFDHGDIILQSDPIDIQREDNYASLEQKLALVGGDLLHKVINEKLYIDPVKVDLKYEYLTAFKIDSKMSKINWSLPSRRIKRLYDALGPLHTFINCNTKKGVTPKRVIFNDIETIDTTIELENPGDFILDDGLIIKTGDGHVKVSQLTFECCSLEDAETFFKRLNKRTKKAKHTFVDI